MGRARTRRTPSAPWWARLSLVAGIVLVVASGGGLGAGAYALHQVDNAVHQESLLDGGVKQDPDAAVKGPLDMLLAGSDLRTFWKSEGKLPRADSIMWLHIPASHDRAYLLSIARDLRVDIPAYAPSGYPGGNEKLNASFQKGMKDVNDVSGGMKLLDRTVRQVTGVDHFDAAGLVNWDGFTEITKELGGVRLCLKKGFTSHQKGFQNMNLTFPAGCHHYKAKKALLLVRQRDDFKDGDYGRQQIQQQFVKQLLKKATDKGVVADPPKLLRIVRAAGKSVTLDTGRYTPINLVLALKNIRSSDLVTLQPPHAPLYNGDTYLGEQLKPGADALFTALRTDRIDRYLADHPSAVSKNVPTPGGG